MKKLDKKKRKKREKIIINKKIMMKFKTKNGI
jgi:hypothetical protein